MDFHTFRALDDKAKEAYLLKKGVHLTTRADANFYIYLYAVGNFYAEVYYHLSTLSVLCIKNFTATENLQPYLSKIDISDLVPSY